jgi:hypothetical protein
MERHPAGRRERPGVAGAELIMAQGKYPWYVERTLDDIWKGLPGRYPSLNGARMAGFHLLDRCR